MRVSVPLVGPVTTDGASGVVAVGVGVVGQHVGCRRSGGVLGGGDGVVDGDRGVVDGVT